MRSPCMTAGIHVLYYPLDWFAAAAGWLWSLKGKALNLDCCPSQCPISDISAVCPLLEGLLWSLIPWELLWGLSACQTCLIIAQHWLQQNSAGLQQDCQNCVFLMKRAAKLAMGLVFCLCAFYPSGNKQVPHPLVIKHRGHLQLPVFVFTCGTSQSCLAPDGSRSLQTSMGLWDHSLCSLGSPQPTARLQGSSGGEK